MVHKKYKGPPRVPFIYQKGSPRVPFRGLFGICCCCCCRCHCRCRRCSTALLLNYPAAQLPCCSTAPAAQLTLLLNCPCCSTAPAAQLPQLHNCTAAQLPLLLNCHCCSTATAAQLPLSRRVSYSCHRVKEAYCSCSCSCCSCCCSKILAKSLQPPQSLQASQNVSLWGGIMVMVSTFPVSLRYIKHHGGGNH